jgi:hypothetical protein
VYGFGGLAPIDQPILLFQQRGVGGLRRILLARNDAPGFQAIERFHKQVRAQGG